MTAPPLEKPITAPASAPASVALGAVELGALDLRGRPVAGAQCRFDPDLHTGPDGAESPAERAARELVAAEVCQACPLRYACFELAMRIRPTHGVWAGLTVAQLDALAGLDLDEVA
ncbi:WhiB family transcriptional regulator [Actinomadura formosensis]|uniref:WhiB family transcriptional regulator n=1 Tax=Actinomadura formosensis TaxID=60706 RepID=UPI00082EE7AA|nr:WhiB family transcriptional regulator [Actinomadura formosensis]